MRVLVQRVKEASVRVDGAVVGAIHAGLLVFVGAMEGDTASDAERLAQKVLRLRIFSRPPADGPGTPLDQVPAPAASGRMNHAVAEIGGAVLLVSQFTLCADTRKGTRPSFAAAMAPADAAALLEVFRATLAAECPVQTGRFGAHMEVSLLNDGPVTIWLDSRER